MGSPVVLPVFLLLVEQLMQYFVEVLRDVVMLPWHTYENKSTVVRVM